MNRASPQSSHAHAQRDWARSPSAMFAAVVLGLASLSTLGIAISRDLQREPVPAIVPLVTEPSPSSGSMSAIHQPTPRPQAIRRIDVNRADLGELDLLPGIGPALGQRIIDFRTQHGMFESIDDLTKVSGIGPRTLDRLRPLVTLGEGGYTTDN